MKFEIAILVTLPRIQIDCGFKYNGRQECSEDNFLVEKGVDKGSRLISLQFEQTWLHTNSIFRVPVVSYRIEAVHRNENGLSCLLLSTKKEG